MKKNLMFLLMFLALHHITKAQDSVLTLTTLVVTAARDSNAFSNTHVTMSILPASETRKLNARSVPEMISELPGVWIQKTAHGGGSPFVRGLTGNQVLELVDGIRLNNATFRYGPNQYLSTIDPFTVSTVEVVRNAYSTLYGSDAIGGVVNILTEEPQFSQEALFRGSATLKGMTAGMEKTANVKLGFSDRNLSGKLTGTLSDFGDVVGADGFRQVPTSYDQDALSGKIRWRPFQRHTLTFSYQRLRQRDVDLYDQVAKRGYKFNKITQQERQLAYIRSTINTGSGLVKGITLTASVHYSNEERSRLKKGSVIVSNEQDRVTSYGLQGEIPMRFSERWNAQTGFDVYLDKVRSSAHDSSLSSGITVSKRGLYADPSQMLSLSVFHQQQAELGRWSVSAGLRMNAYQTRINDTRFGTLEFSPWALAGNAGITYGISGTWKITGSLHSAYRTPNISDLSSFGKFDFGIEVPASDLRPERSLNKEIMVQGIIGRLDIGVSVYDNTLTDLIDRVKSSYEGDTLYQGDRVYQKANVGDAVIRGLETYFRFPASRHWTYSGSLAYTYGQNLTTDLPLRRIPPMFARLNFEYKAGAFYVRGIWNGATEQNRLAPGDLADHRINPNGTPGFGIFSLRSGWQAKFLDLEAGFENILDQQHRYHGSGIDGYGRHAWMRITVSF